jgi:hypothetical protein
VDELQRYLARRRRRLKFAVSIRDPAGPARWARLEFKVAFPLKAVVVVDGRTYQSGLSDLWGPRLGLVVLGNLDDRPAREVDYIQLADLVARGLADFVDRMTAAGWTEPGGYSDRGSEYYRFRRELPPDDTPATLAAIVRRAAAALLGTDRYVLTIEPYQGDSGLIGEYAGYRSLLTMGGFLISAPIVAVLVPMVTRNPLDVALVVGALVATAALYYGLQPGRDPGRSGTWLEPDVALVKLEMHVAESAVVELPIVGPLIERVLSLALALVGVWVPIAVAIVITSAV